VHGASIAGGGGGGADEASTLLRPQPSARSDGVAAGAGELRYAGATKGADHGDSIPAREDGSSRGGSVKHQPPPIERLSMVARDSTTGDGDESDDDGGGAEAAGRDRRRRPQPRPGLSQQQQQVLRPPWGAILRSGRFWAIAICHFCTLWAQYLLISFLPMYHLHAIGTAISTLT
jgi:hypothetical protein